MSLSDVRTCTPFYSTLLCQISLKQSMPKHFLLKHMAITKLLFIFRKRRFQNGSAQWKFVTKLFVTTRHGSQARVAGVNKHQMPWFGIKEDRITAVGGTDNWSDERENRLRRIPRIINRRDSWPEQFHPLKQMIGTDFDLARSNKRWHIRLSAGVSVFLCVCGWVWVWVCVCGA